MTVIYDPIPFVKLVQNILFGNYEPIIGIYGNIFIINLHNLQMLFILWIKYKFSDGLTPYTNMKAPMEDFLATVLPRAAGQFPPNLFYAPQILLRSEKFVLNIW